MKLIEEDRSDHEDSLYFMSEQILEKVPQLSNSLQLPINLFENNQFDLFPSCLRPNNALIIGGSGAKSFLHIDPYEWIGTNYLVKGKKLCKYTAYLPRLTYLPYILQGYLSQIKFLFHFFKDTV